MYNPKNKLECLALCLDCIRPAVPTVFLVTFIGSFYFLNDTKPIHELDFQVNPFRNTGRTKNVSLIDTRTTQMESSEGSGTKQDKSGTNLNQSGTYLDQSGTNLELSASILDGSGSGVIKNEGTNVTFDMDDQQHHPWEADPDCADLVTRFAKKNTLPRRALASYPGSGNTWTRYLIEGATGIFTGSQRSDKRLAKTFLGEFRNNKDGSTIVQKTHGRSILGPHFHSIISGKGLVDKSGGAAIVIVRDPFKAVKSYFNLATSGSHTDAPTNFRRIIVIGSKRMRFGEFALEGVNRWYEILNEWITFGRQVHFLFYEKLKEDPVAEMTKLLHHLKLPVQQKRMRCIQSHLSGSFLRKKHPTVDPFSQDTKLVAKFRAIINKARFRIEKFNGQILPVKMYEHFQNPPSPNV